MTPQEFQHQMSRVADTFGKDHYRPERLKILWDEIQIFEARWLHKVITKFIAECERAPMIKHFREEMSKERERIAEDERRKHQADAEAFWEGSLHTDEIADICGKIKRRITNRITDPEWESFTRLINDHATKGENQ